MTHILFISTAFPPHQESQTIRNIFLARGLSELGHRLSFVTPEPDPRNSDESLMALMPKGNWILTRRPYLMRLMERISRLPAGRHLVWLLGVFGNFFILPDMGLWWDNQVVAAVREICEEDRPDLILTSSGSYTAHLAGERLTRRWGIPLVLELGDPWSRNPIWPSNFVFRRVVNHFLERRVITQARAIVVTTEETASDYRQWLEAKCPPVFTVPMGYLPAEFADASEAPVYMGSPVEVKYVGVAYRTGRNIGPLLGALQKVSQARPVRFDFIGKGSQSFLSLARKNNFEFAHFLQPVSYNESLKIIKSAGILVIVGNSGGLQVPGKTYMYLASGRPILLLSQDVEDRDPTWRLLKNFRGTFRSNGKVEELVAVFNKILDDYPNVARESYLRLSDSVMKEYQWGIIGANFAKSISGVLGGGNGE